MRCHKPSRQRHQQPAVGIFAVRRIARLAATVHAGADAVVHAIVHVQIVRVHVQTVLQRLRHRHCLNHVAAAAMNTRDDHRSIV